MDAVVVPKQIDAKRQIWFMQDKERTKIGFTEEFLNTVKECWHVTPAVKGQVAANSPLLTVETNDALFTVSSPAGGHIETFSHTAQNFPDKLTEDDVVCIIGPKKVKKTVGSFVVGDFDLDAIVMPEVRVTRAPAIPRERWFALDDNIAAPQPAQPQAVQGGIHDAVIWDDRDNPRPEQPQVGQQAAPWEVPAMLIERMNRRDRERQIEEARARDRQQAQAQLAQIRQQIEEEEWMPNVRAPIIPPQRNPQR